MHTITLYGNRTKTIIKLLQEMNIPLLSPCGGIGICGKCKVRVLSNVPKPSSQDRIYLSLSDLEKGYRLACSTVIAGEFTVEVESPKEVSVPEQDLNNLGTIKITSENNELGTPPSDIFLAIDIGTTTISAALVSKAGKVLGQASTVNHQSRLGADVISRIRAGASGEGQRLKTLVRQDLECLGSTLGVDLNKVPTIISANTSMVHLFMGWDVSSLGVYPYTPVSLDFAREDNMIILPAISTFVGGDIVSGLSYILSMEQQDKGIASSHSLLPTSKIIGFIDIGTNSEMALVTPSGILTTSAAAGPAFEGGNISCGIGGVEGAISSVKITKSEAGFNVNLATVGGKSPLGICGSGLLSLASELLKNGIMDSTGALRDSYIDFGFELAKGIKITQNDVRELQLAKASIRAGFEVLASEAGISLADIDILYLGGGFGQKLNLEDSFFIGLIPHTLSGKTYQLGNTSLLGAISYALGHTKKSSLMEILQKARYIDLVTSDKFNEKFIREINFNQELD